ncbi:hypothetical protein Tco_0313203 [Tanacetum coccineum]
MRSGIPRSSKKEVKGNNIVSNISSFIPMVQQKQAAAVCTGKSDIKVKALEAAKRRKENALELELNKKKKLREQKEKRSRYSSKKKTTGGCATTGYWKYMRHGNKVFGELKVNWSATLAVPVPVAIAGYKKGAENKRQNKNTVKNSLQTQHIELRPDNSLASVVQQVASISENRDASNDCGVKESNETDARISSIYAASVARIQRSKSRHKALKRRTNKAGKDNDRILVLLMPPSDKLVDAVETSQRLSEGVTKGVLKPCCSSSYTESRSGSPKESALGVVNLENGEPVVENGPTDAPVEVQPSDETCSPLSKKRKMDGFESASSVDHKSISTFFERQSLIANVVSSSPKAADTLSDNHFDERINYETTNLGLETDENLVGGDFSI